MAEVSRTSILQSSLSGGGIARNVLWSFAGPILPVITALLVMPPLIHRLGTDRFGILTIAWVVTGYFSLFDLGLGRALTQLISQRIDSHRELEIPSLAKMALLLMMYLGAIGAISLALLSRPLVHIFTIPSVLEREATIGFYWISASVPVVILTSGFRGILEAYHRFPAANTLRSVTGMLSLLGPLAVVAVTSDLRPVIAVLFFVRFVGLLAHWQLAERLLPVFRSNAAIHWSQTPLLFSLGGWMTVSNIVGPVMVYMDRFLIGFLLSMTAVTYYATPYEIVSKLWLIPVAISGVLFPTFTVMLERDRSIVADLYHRAVKYTYLVTFPAIFGIITLAPVGLRFWLGTEFSTHSAPVLQWLAAGVFFNCLGYIPFTLLQSLGRPDLTAKTHLLELPCYLVLFFLLVHRFGLKGAAFAWFIRMLVDTAIMFWLTRKFIASPKKLGPVVAVVTAALAGPFGWFLSPTPTAAVAITIVGFSVFAPLAWFVAMDQRERDWAGRLFPRGSQEAR
jgi:O-antigen/teichoic acid export membrane protein